MKARTRPDQERSLEDKLASVQACSDARPEGNSRGGAGVLVRAEPAAPGVAKDSAFAALPLVERDADPRTADSARRHRDVIARFGRFPHRNTVLGRVSRTEELAFAATAGLTLLRCLSVQRLNHKPSMEKRRSQQSKL